MSEKTRKGVKYDLRYLWWQGTVTMALSDDALMLVMRAGYLSGMCTQSKTDRGISLQLASGAEMSLSHLDDLHMLLITEKAMKEQLMPGLQAMSANPAAAKLYDKIDGMFKFMAERQAEYDAQHEDDDWDDDDDEPPSYGKKGKR